MTKQEEIREIRGDFRKMGRQVKKMVEQTATLIVQKEAHIQSLDAMNEMVLKILENVKGKPKRKNGGYDE